MSCRNRLYRDGILLAALIAVFLGASANAIGQFLGATPSTTQPSPGASLDRHTAENELGSILLPGDEFQIQIYNVPQFDFKGRVDDDGSVALPLVGKKQLAGLTIGAAQKMIAEALVDAGYMKAPQVFVHILASPNHFATVSGEVKNPGTIELYGQKHLLDILSAAGGLTPISSPLVTIYRRGASSPLQVELPTDPSAIGAGNILIFPGDSIVVAKLGVVYVLGAFHQQGAIPLRNNAQITLIKAMSLAGGVNYEAAANKAFILRTTPTGQAQIPFNVSELLKHKAPDMILQNEDIVLIPSNSMKAALKGGAAGVAASLLAGIGYITVK